MRKTKIFTLLVLIVCLSACGTSTQIDDPSNAVSLTEVEIEEDVSVGMSQQETAEDPDVDVIPQDAGDISVEGAEFAGEQQSQVEVGKEPSADILDENGIIIEFDGELVEVSAPLRVYSMMFTRTLDNYYDIAPGTAFTVTNSGENENTYVTVNVVEYMRSTASFETEVNHDGEHKWMNMLGEFWNNDESLCLSDQLPGDAIAGENLCWAVGELFGDQPQFIKLYPGESVTFHLPERDQDAVYFVNARYQNDAGELGLPSNSCWVAACDVSTPLECGALQ